jgi:hypothetical protein
MDGIGMAGIYNLPKELFWALEKMVQKGFNPFPIGSNS